MEIKPTAGEAINIIKQYPICDNFVNKNYRLWRSNVECCKYWEECRKIVTKLDCMKMKLSENKHYWLSGQSEKPTIVYYYFNHDAGMLGFGFNIADGGAFLPLTDLLGGSVLEGPIEYYKSSKTGKAEMCTVKIKKNHLKQNSMIKGKNCAKPPLVVVPRFINNQNRALAILDAMSRYIRADLPVKAEWIDELRDLINISSIKHLTGH